MRWRGGGWAPSDDKGGCWREGRRAVWSGKAAMHRLWYLSGEGIVLMIEVGELMCTTQILRSAVATTISG